MLHFNISGKLLAVGALAVLLGLNSCKSTTTATTPSSAYKETDLVADIAGLNAPIIDPTFKNGWGISVGSTGNFWLSSNHGGVTTIYDSTGATKLAAITIPSRNGTDAGSPTGVIFNSSTDFKGYLFIYSSEDGVISGWQVSSGFKSAAKLATDPSVDAVYKGIAMATNGASNNLYVADFKENKIVIYDKNFAPTTVSGNFTETGLPAIPSDFGPFGIQNVGGLLYVTYAKHKPAPDNGDDLSGLGNGYVSVFNPDGTFVKRFASNGTLNSPWGITTAPATFGDFKNAILISNFGDGTINGYDATSGNYIGQLKDASGNVIHIDGLWGLMFTTAIHTDPNALYFTAGPGGENHGVFGYLKLQ